MGLLKVPVCAVAATVKVPDMPEGMVMVAGAALKETVGGTGAGTGTGTGMGAGGVVLLQLGLYAVAPLIWFARVGLPTASTNI
jgi:hypothetical protein